jgi:hypothetical protein
VDCSRIRKRNRQLLELPDSHPAKRFLLAFIVCGEECLGREIGWGDNQAIEQEWYSETDGKHWTFSGFAYSYLAFDIELDGYLANAPKLTEEEEFVLGKLPYLRTLMSECSAAARAADNQPILELVSLVVKMLELWERAIRYRESKLGGQGS